MKIRNGFVSNSSSSSFLVAFPRNPKSVEDVKEMVFGKNKVLNNPYVWGDRPASYPVEEIAEIIWNDVKRQIPNNRKIILSHLSNVVVDSLDKYKIPVKDGSSHDYDWDRYEIDNEKEVVKFMEKYTGAFFYCFEYYDNAGALGSTMEHGDLFRLLPHLQSSNH